jgi:anti-sigma regulatory factor (Ser/Thr protein kinase)
MTLGGIGGPVVVEIPSDPCSLFLVRCLVERLTRRLGFSNEAVSQIILAVDEACTNVIRHAYKNCPGERIVLTFLTPEDRLEIHVRDFGIPPDPKALQPRDLNEVRPGGLGLHFIKSAMDEIRYESPPEGGGLLRMIKFRNANEVSDT